MSRLLLFLGAGALLAQDSWTPDTAMQVKRVTEVMPSPDGKLAVWTQARALMDGEKSEYLSHVFLWRGGDSKPLQLTRGEKGAKSPAFSPDGAYVYFLSDRTGKPNLFRIAVAGGEAEQLTDWKGTLGAYAVSPDGKSIAFTGAEADSNEEKAKKEKRDFKVVDEKPRLQALWLIPADEDAAGKRMPKRLTQNAGHTGDFDWSPDSRAIVFEIYPTPDADDSRRADIAEVTVESGAVRTIVNSAAQESQPAYSPDGRYIAFAQGNRLLGQHVHLFTRASGEVRKLAGTPDLGPRIIGWSRDGKQVMVAEPRSVRGGLYGVPIDGPAVATLHAPSSGTFTPMRLNSTATHLGMTRESASEPVEAFVMDTAPAAAKAVQVSRANASLPKLAVGETKLVKWKGHNGTEVEGLLTLPSAAARPAPMVLVIHGGPAGVFADSFIGSAGIYPIASFSSKGYAVLRPNPRGSVGYGTRFRTSNTKDWGGGDYKDLMAGVDAMVAQGIADPNRLAVMGWSYGGYMTSWVISQTTRFKAAAIGAGITNVWSMWGTNDIPSVLDDYFGGAPWETPELYMSRSALYHVKNVSTPTLFLHGEQDFRVPISQAYEYYHALKRRGVTAKMVAYPRMPHGPQEPKFILDIMQRHLDWVDKYVR